MKDLFIPKILQNAIFGLLLFASAGVHASGTISHDDPLTSVILGATVIFFLAIMGRYLAKLLHQPGVLGELLMGVLVGNLGYFFGSNLAVILREGSSLIDVIQGLLSGSTLSQAVTTVIPNAYYAYQVIDALSAPQGIEYLKIAYVVDVFSRYGVIFLLFMVGLETSIDELKKTGKASLMVALIGVIAPMILGYGVAYLLTPTSDYRSDLFIAATLCATSIGITARVLSELKLLKIREARTILGAAMIDDILGLVILSIVTSIVISGTIDTVAIVRISILSLLFFVGAILLGPVFLRKGIAFFHFLEPWEAKLFISFLFVMLLAWLASILHLAAIIGAFIAGIILHDGYFSAQNSYKTIQRTINNLVSPLESLLAPIFFMLIGIQVKLETFLHLNVLMLATGLVFAAVLGKLISGLGAGRQDDRLFIGIGMLPRGEVGLVFASLGRTLGVISDELFSSIVLMVVFTTFIAPPLLKARYTMKKKEAHGTREKGHSN